MNKSASAYRDHELYTQYTHLRNEGMFNIEIAKRLDLSKKHLAAIISHYEFKSDIEYRISRDKGDFKFDGDFNLSSGVLTTLGKQEIAEIFNFTKNLVKHHGGIDQIQRFYSIENDCEVLFVDQPLARYPLPGKMTLMLANEF